MQNFIKFILLFLFVSCSTNNSLTNRSLSSVDDSNCRRFLKSFITSSDDSSIELKNIINYRKSLEEHYTNIEESVKDLELSPDLPIHTSAKIVLDPKEALLAKIMLIRKAKKTIDMSYFIFTEDESSKAILHELRLAIKRGVKVRLMVDSMGSLSKAPFYSDIKSLVALSGKPILDKFGNPTGERAYMEAVLFNPIFNIRAHVRNWYRKIYNLISTENKLPPINFSFNKRSHDKILLIDSFSPEDSMVMLGGRNIADHYYGINDGEEHFISDAEIILKGISSRDENGKINNVIEEHYNRLFFYLANKNFSDFLIKINLKVVKREFRAMRSASNSIIGEEGTLEKKMQNMISKKYLDEGFENSLVNVVSEIQNLTRSKVFLHPSKHNVETNHNSIIAKLNEHISKAKKSIDIVTPYFWMPDEEIDYLIKWLEQDPRRKIRIITNSILTNNHLASQALIDNVFQKKIYQRIKGTPLEDQFLLFNYGRYDHELMGGSVNYGLLHAKVFMVDDKHIMVSTSNLDPISRYINSEFGISTTSLEEESNNAMRIEMYIDRLISRSTRVGSPEYYEILNHKRVKQKVILEKFIQKIIYLLNLEPIL